MAGSKMGRPRKNGRILNINLSADVYDILEEHCERAGQTKTLAVERAIRLYCQSEKAKSKDA